MPIKRKINRPVTAIYIHIPFCQHICDYCDFPKLQYFRLFASKYLSALQKEMDSYNVPDTIETIYVGGGTPTALDDDLFLELLKILKLLQLKMVRIKASRWPLLIFITNLMKN